MCTILVYSDISSKNVYGNHWEKIGQHFPFICYILHLTCFNFNHKISSTLQTNIRSIFSSSPMGMGPLPLSFPISWYCKLDTGMQKPKLQPELQMQHKGCRWTCCSDLPIWQALYQPGMVLNPGGPESLKWSTSSSPLLNSQNSSQKREQTKILAQHSQRVIWPP